MPTRQSIAEQRQVVVYKGNRAPDPGCRFFDDRGATPLRILYQAESDLRRVSGAKAKWPPKGGHTES
jgi:hypothetical protein